MAAFLNCKEACTYNLENTKTIGDKLYSIHDLTSQHKRECNEIC